ncbi:MAG: heavy metal-binding domain-containing protein [Desulfurococcaceae archaeon]
MKDPTKNYQDLKVLLSEREAEGIYLGIVYGTSVRSSGFARDALSAMRDFFGGRSKGYEDELGKAINEALDSMKSQAIKLGASKVVNVRFELMPFGQGDNKGGFFVVMAYGEAYK